MRLACAVLASSMWLGFTGWMLRDRWRGKGGDGAGDLLVAYASQTGFAARIAEATAAALREAGQEVALLPLGEVDAAQFARARRALFVAATTGEGDPPDDAARFVAHVMQSTPALAGLNYAVLALGDRNYRNFCAFGHRLDRWLADHGAVRAADLIEVDAADPGALRHWQQNLGLFGAAADAPDWAPPAYRAGRLTARTHLNPSSPGEATFHVAITPDAPIEWTAGDIAEIYPGPAADGLNGTPALPHRDYSIASVMEDGAIELVVRRMRRDDGTLGLGSGWLTEGAGEGTPIAFRVRSNPAFHAPATDRPLILIGSGTGIAGLRVHLKARPPASRNWLLFGERSKTADALFADELVAWQRDGRLARLDRCFSRDGGGYVQGLLAAQAGIVRAWVDDGAAIYVCGSVSGMAAGVDATLASILGRTGLDELAVTGRYRRDVY